MVLALTACKSKAAKEAETLINAIGEVTAESEAAVTGRELSGSGRGQEVPGYRED